jgi:hypothetical protein
MNHPSVEESRVLLQRAGWAVRDTVRPDRYLWRWVVAAARGESTIEVSGATQAEAWHRACQQALAALPAPSSPRTKSSP